MPNVEEFGIAAVEAQASGRPVIAADGGGVQETTIAGETSVLVPPGDVKALAEAMRETDFDRFSSERIRAHAVALLDRRVQASVRRRDQRLTHTSASR